MRTLRKSLQNIFRTSAIVLITLFLPHGVYDSKCNDKDLLFENNKSVVCEHKIENKDKDQSEIGSAIYVDI